MAGGLLASDAEIAAIATIATGVISGIGFITVALIGRGNRREVRKVKNQLTTENDHTVAEAVENIQINLKDQNIMVEHLRASLTSLHDLVGSMRRSQERTETRLHQHIIEAERSMQDAEPLKQFIVQQMEMDQLARAGRIERRNDVTPPQSDEDDDAPSMPPAPEMHPDPRAKGRRRSRRRSS